MPALPWKTVLADNAPLILPSAADALTARLIERAGFPAYQVGGFALAAAMHAVPDIDLEQYGEKHAKAREIIEASNLPVLVDADDGYGDAKNVTRTVRGYEASGASALFIEDQEAPKRCGHMAGKRVVSTEDMEQKIRAAVAARNSRDFFLLARTDAREVLGLDEAIARGERYLGYSMILYPTTVLFRAVHAIQIALDDLKRGRPLSAADSVDLQSFEDVVNMSEWSEIESRFMAAPEEQGVVGKLKRALGGA